MILISNLCNDAGFILGIIAQLVKIIRWVVPILLIVLISFDLFKTLAGQVDEKAKKEAFGKITKRLLYAVIIFLVPTIVNMVLLKIAPLSRDNNGNVKVNTTSTSYLECWNYYYNK